MRKRGRRPLPEYTSLGCVMTRNLSGWCFRLCKPENGIGRCGRVYPFATRSRIQRGIDRFKRMKALDEARG